MNLSKSATCTRQSILLHSQGFGFENVFAVVLFTISLMHLPVEPMIVVPVSILLLLKMEMICLKDTPLNHSVFVVLLQIVVAVAS